MITTVLFHSADFDGLFCREIARKFLGDKDVEYIGWNFGDAPVLIPSEGPIYVMDLPADRPFGFQRNKREDGETVIRFQIGSDPRFMTDHNPFAFLKRVIWIDHHKSSIETHPSYIPGYRIDGVAACRLAWQWFNKGRDGYAINTPSTKEPYVERRVSEPLAVRLAGEYDIWRKDDPRAETLQYGLRCLDLTLEGWQRLLGNESATMVSELLITGERVQRYQQKIDADLATHRSYRLNWEGLKWIVLNTGRFNSLTFAALDKPETGHDALLGYMFNGKVWTVSLYQAKHRTDLDLSAIAVKYGGGGHRGACGFTCTQLPWTLPI